MKKRLWAVLLTICLVAALLPTTALAAGSENTISKDTTWESATTLDHDLTISTDATLTVKGSITVQGTVTISGGGTIKRADEYNAEIFNVSTGNSLTLNGVVLDGGAVYGNAPENATENTNATAMKEFLGFDYENNTGKKDVGLLIDVAGGSLVMRNNTVLQNNATSASARDNYYNDYPENRTCAGIGVRAGGIFTMEGGQISRMVGPSVLVNDLESKFIMSGGEISNSQGNAVLCYGEMKMTAGSISRHTNTNNTAVGLRGDNASFYMDGGEISNNFGVGGNYGTIMATSGADQKIDLLGGQIHDNRGTYGTALVTFGTPNVHIGGNCKIHHNAPGTGANSNCVWIAGAGGTLLIDGNAEISNNTASPTLLIDCTATLAGDAKIENNTWTGRNGYAVNVRAGSTTIKDQFSISNNISYNSVYGTGLYISKGTTVNMMGGVIKNNSSYNHESNSVYYHGGGVSFDDAASAAQLNLSGSATISGNKTFLVDSYENPNVSKTIDSDINLTGKTGALTIAGALTTTETIGILDGRRTSVNNTVIATGANNYSITDVDMTKFVYSTDATHNPGKTIYLDRTDNSIKVADAVNVTLHANNGTDETAVQKVPVGIETLLMENPFTRLNYTFIGWNTNENGNGTTYADKANISASEDVNLYAQWNARQLSDIEVVAKNANVPYGTVLSKDNFTVTAVYDNGEREPVTEFSVSPNTALTTPGTVQVTVTYQEKAKTCAITVDKASQAAPTSAPTLKDRTYTSITLNAVKPNANGAAAQYSKDGGKTWQESAEFTELTSNTTYTFAVRYAEKAPYAASAASATAEFSTLYRSSGSSSDPTYSVTTPSKTENGSVTVSPKSASKGDTVTITVKPDSGYVLDDLTVTDKNGNELTLKDKGNGKYTFVMPAGKVEVKATFAKEIEVSPFADVATDGYYYEAVKWAVKNGITTGVGNDLFAPGQPCTRAQIVTFLWRAAGAPEPKGTAASLTDVVSGSYYEKAVAWAIENGITTGTGDSKFSPDATCTRAQAVTFLARALNAKAASAAEFSDVPTDSYFADAVAWAAANGVTEGIGGSLFGSDNDCTRGQIVTFLYRAYNK